MRYVVVIFIVLVFAGLLYLFNVKNAEQFEGQVTEVGVEETEINPADITIPAPGSNDTNAEEETAETHTEDLRVQTMREEYEKLEKMRRNLKRRLARIKVLLWDIKLPKTKATEITEDLRNAYALLKMPRMLGAFSGLEDLRQELTKVEYAYNKADEIMRFVEQEKQQKRD